MTIMSCSYQVNWRQYKSGQMGRHTCNLEAFVTIMKCSYQVNWRQYTSGQMGRLTCDENCMDASLCATFIAAGLDCFFLEGKWTKSIGIEQSILGEFSMCYPDSTQEIALLLQMTIAQVTQCTSPCDVKCIQTSESFNSSSFIRNTQFH